VLRHSFVKQPPEGPPVCATLNFFPLGIPPPIPYIISPKDIPMGTSINPVLFISPVREKTLVPELLSVPTLKYFSAPSRIIIGILPNVSTLFITVGFLNIPSPLGYGGF